MDCLNDIVTIRGCSSVTPLSGLDLMDAPEITKNNLANIANEKDVQGWELAQRLLSLSHTLVASDMMNVLAANRMLVDITDRSWQTSEFRPQTPITADGAERGLTLYRVDRNWQKSLKKLKIETIKIFPLADYAGAVVKIYDNGGLQDLTNTYSFDLIGGEINEFDVNYEVQGEYAIVAVRGDMVLGSSYLMTCAGCLGKMPNDCGYTKSYASGKSTNGHEGYGVGVVFSCECDYDRILCNLSKKGIGKIIWTKARLLLLEERIKTNRLNNLIVYGVDEAKEWYNQLAEQYRLDWEVFAKSLPKLLAQYSDCIFCNGIRSVINV